MKPDLDKVNTLAKDFSKTYPRSPREMLGGYVIGARCADKCRAFLLGMNGEYNYWPCSLAGLWFTFTGVTPEQFKEVVATGATDEELAAWLRAHSKVQDKTVIIQWNNQMRGMRLSEMTPQVQAYTEDYIPQYVPKHRPVYAYFGGYDLEEKRL
ncbi:MAG: DUF5069 domain-containing protein [Nitrospira defluvii]|nr:DUF5069 domain-containing protein [Nitrospira defluvii]